ncbi:MAG: N-acetylmuramoyl-L-alanine amidase [Phycisphaerae bacterium]
MAADAARHQNRHFKTLILLVIAMTVGTFFLFWVDRLTPLTARTATPWREIAIRSAGVSGGWGFYHIRIDEAGDLYETNAWQTGPRDPRANGTIHVVLTRRDPRRTAPHAQAVALARVLEQLRGKYRIPQRQVRVVGQGDAVTAAGPRRHRRSG